MIKKSIRAGAIICAALLAPLFSQETSHAQPLADRVPADACIYAGWAGIGSMGPEFNESRFKAVLEASDFGKLISEYLPEVMGRFPEASPEDRVSAKVAATMLAAMWEYPSAIVVSGVSEREPGRLGPKVMMICQPGDGLPALRTKLQTLIDSSEPIKNRVRIDVHRNFLALAVGYRANELVIAGPPDESGVRIDALSNNNAFRQAMSRLQPMPKTAAFIHIESILTQADKHLTQQASDKPAESREARRLANFKATRDGLGLTSAQYFAASGGFDGKDWAVRAYLSAPLPRRGIVTLIDSGPLAQGFIRAIPRNPDIAMAGRLDLWRLVQQLIAPIRENNPETAKQIDSFIAAPFFAPEINLRTGLIEPLGDQWALYSDPTITGRGPLGWVAVARPLDSAVVEDSLAKLVNKALAVFNARRQNKPQLKLVVHRIGPYQVNTIAAPIVSPSWVAADGNIYFALFPQNAVAAAQQVSRNRPSIAENPDFVAMLNKTNIRAVTGFKYYDIAQTAPDAYPVLLSLSRLVLGTLDMKTDLTPPMVVPRLNDLTDHLGRSVYVTWADASGWSMAGKTPFPGAELLTIRLDTNFLSSTLFFGGLWGRRHDRD